MSFFFKNLFLILIFVLPFMANAQPYPLSLHTKYDDDFAQWEVFVEDENGDEVEGYMDMRWKSRNDWTKWDYRIGERSGSIEMRFRNDPYYWEFRENGEIITAKTLWSQNTSEWRITNNSTSFNLKEVYYSNGNEWVVLDEKHGEFRIYMQYEDDPRDWVIEDDLYDTVSFPFKMAIIFLSTFNSSPIRN